MHDNRDPPAALHKAESGVQELIYGFTFDVDRAKPDSRRSDRGFDPGLTHLTVGVIQGISARRSICKSVLCGL